MTICNPWRAGACLLVLREQCNTLAPARVKGSDGTIGDTAHQAEACSSQHNSCCVKYNGVWIIRAIDITHDPARGCDIGVIFDRIRASQDNRVRYLIFNRRICYPTSRNGYAPWAWQPYSGSDPHTNHGHLSTFDDAARFDNTRAWAIGTPTPAGVQPAATLEDDVYYRLPDGGIFVPSVNGPVGISWDEYVSAGQPRFMQLASAARLSQLCPTLVAPSVSIDAGALAQTVAQQVAAALAADPNVEGISNDDVERVSNAVASSVLDKFGAALAAVRS